MNKQLRALLVTWYSNYNYGTVLQAYALKSVIEDPSITGLIEKPYSWNYRWICCRICLAPEKRNRWKKLLVPGTYISKLNRLRDKKIYNDNKVFF